MTKTKQTPTPLDLAATKVRSIEETIEQEQADLQPLKQEQTRLLAKEVHSFAETDRLAEVTKEMERREDHLNHLRHVALADAVALQRRLELLALAEDGAQGIVGKHEEMERRVAEAERKVAEGLAEARAAVDDWNSFLQPLLAVAEEAGQDSRNPADPDHPVTVVIDSMRPYRPLYLEIDGEAYRPRSADAAAQHAAGNGDQHLAHLLRLGAEEETISEVRRGRWSR